MSAIVNVLNGIDGLSLAAVDTLIKATVLLGVAGVATLALGRASAAMRHLVWTLAIGSALLLPVLSAALPRWQLPIVRVTAAPPLSIDLPETRARLRQGYGGAGEALRAKAETSEPVDAPAAAVESIAPAQPIPAEVPPTPISLGMMLLSVWAVGAALVLSRLIVGLLAVRWLARRTAPVLDAPWLPLAVELASDLGVTHRLRFLESARATMPMACGILRPTVLMPADAVRWPIERLRIVLLHELAHVKRRDCLTHVVVQLACALYWFNPLAWIAARHIRTERERACDDLVLASGTRGADYAEELLEIARGMRAGRFPALLTGATLAMAHRSQLEGRLIAILDPRVPRAGVSRVRAAVAMATVACALPPLATLQPWMVEQVSAATRTAEVVTNPAPAAAVAMAEPASSQQALSPQPMPAPAPQPMPQPAPPAQPSQINQAAANAVREIAASIDVQAITQSVAQSLSQTAVQSSVESAVQSAFHVPPRAWQESGSSGAAQTQAAKRATADPRMVAALVAALKDSDKEVRETAMNALIQMRDPSIFEPLVQALKDTSPDVREQAVHGLVRLRDRRAIDPISALVKDANASVREAVVHALGQFKDPRTFDPMVTALKDENPSVREQAAHALGQMRDPRAVDPLTVALKDANADVREQAAHALGQIRDKRAAAALAGAIKDTDPDVREQAVFALGQIRDAAAIDGLTLALRDEKADVRQQAAFALGQIRDARAVQPLISGLKDADAEVREQAAFALGQIRDRSAVEALVIALKDSAASVREQVAFALGQLRDPRAIDGLTNALKDESADVRRQAAFALGQLAR
jgi:HEAT repeat protein/beta-lactamase regulating signal transducer with metallopeptidase domain